MRARRDDQHLEQSRSTKFDVETRCRFQGRAGSVALDQLRTVGADRLLKSLGPLSPEIVRTVLQQLHDMFAE